ncbi:MAG: deoxynucleoside kinase [archaeon]
MTSLSSFHRDIAVKQLDKYISSFSKYEKEGIYVSIEGLIGVGKTTLAKNIKDFLLKKGEKCILIEEEVNLDWLNAYISKPKEYASLFQIKRLCSTINAVTKMGQEVQIRKEYGTKVSCVGDRLPLGNFSFALVHFISGNISEDIFNLYGTALADGGPFVYPDVILLLTPPKTAMKRIKERDRRGESSYTIDYLEKLDESTLFTMLYIWCSKIINIIPINYDKYRKTDEIVNILSLPKKDISNMKSQIMTMNYDEMKSFIYSLSY